MPIRFRCPLCNTPLSIAEHKAGALIQCPACRSPLTVPAVTTAPAVVEAPSQRDGESATWIAAGLVAGVLFLGLLAAVVVGVVILGSQSQPAQQTIEEVVAVRGPSRTEPEPAVRTTERAPDVRATEPAPAVRGTEKSEPPPSVSRPMPPMVEPHEPPPDPPRLLLLDSFGNPTGTRAGLARDGEFAGKRLMFWCGSKGFLAAFFPPENPLLKALKTKGFTLRLEEGQFQKKWLQEIDQLWICSVGQGEQNYPNKANLAAFKALVKAGKTTGDFGKRDLEATLKALTDPAGIDDSGYAALEEFVKAGKGLCLLADDEPFSMEADAMARRLFGCRVVGNYPGEKIAYVRGRKLSPDDIKKYKGEYEINDHPLLTDVNFLYEGITISHIEPESSNPGAIGSTAKKLGDKLEAAISASDGQVLIAVSKVPGWHVVIDCGYTRYTYGSTDAHRFVSKTAGTLRFAENVAAYLMGKDH